MVVTITPVVAIVDQFVACGLVATRLMRRAVPLARRTDYVKRFSVLVIREAFQAEYVNQRLILRPIQCNIWSPDTKKTEIELCGYPTPFTHACRNSGS